jgi:hypothetical protein
VGTAASGSQPEAAEVPKNRRPTGPLPSGALAAYAAKSHGRGNKKSSYGPRNDIHNKGSWFRFATYSKNWKKKLAKIRFYSDPPGALRLVSKDKVFNLAWMMRCRKDWYPGYSKAKRLNVRFDYLREWLSPKADWKTFTGYAKDSVKNIPAMVQAAGVVVAGVYTGGASMQKDPQGQIKKVTSAIETEIKNIGDTGKDVKKRLKAADVVIGRIGQAYIEQVKAANPWIVMTNGKIDIGKNFKPNPKTYEDLFDRSYVGKGARPLLFNPG